MPPLRPKTWPAGRPTAASEALLRKLIDELPKQIIEEKMAVATYRHYKGNWYEVVHDPAAHSVTGETFVVYRKLGIASSSIVARHTETLEWFEVRLELSGAATLLPVGHVDPTFAPDFVHLWARPRAMFHGTLPDGRHRFVRRTATVAAIVETLTRANAHLERARAHLDSDDPLAASHAAAEIRNAQRAIEGGST